MSRANAPLTGLTVIEFGNLIAAPYAGMLLADLGAEVIKVEPPTGDLGRGFGPYLNGESAFFLSANRGKRSVVVDFPSDQGRDAALELCRTADAIITNLRPGAMERLGLAETDIRRINPSVVYGVVSAFGSDGPYAERSGIDVVFQGESGMMSITGDPGSPPGKTATTIGDYVAGTNLALGVCAALVERSRTGTGRRIDVSLRDGLLAVQGGWMALAFAAGAQPEKTGTASPYLAPNQAFAAADGHLTLAIVSDRHFERLCTALNRPDLAARYPTNDDRMTGRDELTATLTEIFRTAGVEDWIELLAPIGLPIGRVLTLPETWEDPQVIYNEMVPTYEHPVAGSFRVVGSPIRVDGRPAISKRPPPVLGGTDQEASSVPAG
jgi:crotonobetainyl-CoA:carnitine CoA-transferase CaiB-like acyl-CoA transferase